MTYMARLARDAPGGIDLAVLDVFDGEDATPSALSSPGEAWLPAATARMCLTASDWIDSEPHMSMLELIL